MQFCKMVWATTTKLGCAINRCDNITTNLQKPIYFIVCVYAPPGGFFSTRPYTAGPSCSKCPRGYGCSDRLCVKRYTTGRKNK
uniref:SCP domain-containing protein n=1 Tax=Mesocestoides corti TaxID=53468 RepID=A0A5K3EPF5_MESCO